MKGRELVGEPCDGERLATARRVLDQVALSRALHSRVGHQPPHAIELLVAWEDKEAPAIPPPLIVLLLDLVDELAHQVEHAVTRPCLVPKVGRWVTVLSRRDGRIAGPTELASVEGKEPRLRPC